MSTSAKVSLGILIGVVVTTEVFWFVRLERENRLLKRLIVGLDHRIQNTQVIPAIKKKDELVNSKPYKSPIAYRDPDIPTNDPMSKLRSELEVATATDDITKGYNNLMGVINDLVTPEDEALISILKGG